jgi:hypothetical protein
LLRYRGRKAVQQFVRHLGAEFAHGAFHALLDGDLLGR